MNKVTKSLVVGASGFVGKVLCAQLQKEGIKVKALLRQQQSGPWDETVIGNLSDAESKRSEIFSDVDTVFYLASIAHNKAPASEYEKVNVDLCLNFAQQAINSGVKNFVYVSSTKAMAEPYERIADENFLDMPQEPYGLSKRHAEEKLLALSKNKETGFEHLVIVRPCLIYGAGVQGNLQSMMKMIDKGLFPPLPQTPARRSMISVTDVTRALIAVAKEKKSNRQVYILTDGQQYAVKELEDMIRRGLGKKIPGWHIPYFIFAILGKLPVASRVVFKLLGPALYSSQKITQETDWQPSEKFSDVLPAMAAHYRSHLS